LDFLYETFTFSTGVPFGYFIFYGFVFALVTAGITSLGLSYFLPKARLPLGVVGLLSVALVTLFFYTETTNSVELNVVFEQSDILGDWEDGDSQLRFLANGKLHFILAPRYLSGSSGQTSGVGSWEREGDFNIRIVAKDPVNFSLHMRVIQFNDSYRIIHDDFEDFDEWDHHLGFQRKQK
jgi:hypothetical protein